jgi:Domain of unknown function (DUF222)/HNH endonuclease
MSNLRSAIDEVAAADPASMPDARVEEDFEEVQRTMDRLEAVRMRLLSELDRRRPFERDGFLSTTAWLASRFRMAFSTAKESVQRARSLRDMPGTAEAFEAGDVSPSSVRVLVSARDAHVLEYRRGEQALVEIARDHPIGDLRRAISHWSQALDHTDPEARGEALRARRRLHVSATFAGMVRIDGDLDPETGEVVMTALRAATDEMLRDEGPDERCTPAQRRADALGEITRQWLDRSDRPTVAGERPHMTITVPLRDLVDGDGAGELDHVGPVTVATVRALACDASVTRLVFGPASEPLDVGRRTPVVPAALRRAVVARDRHCRFPGCDRPHGWCDAHHVRHWADGGPTSLRNLVLLCRRHHRLTHRGFRIELVDGNPQFRRPDGSVIDDRGPPDGNRFPP